jgi:hypothetical protein
VAVNIAHRLLAGVETALALTLLRPMRLLQLMKANHLGRLERHLDQPALV